MTTTSECCELCNQQPEHTCMGTCGCHHTSSQEGWEKEFDKKFGGDIGHHYEFCNCGENDENKCAADLKSFITRIISQERERAEQAGRDAAVDYIESKLGEWFGGHDDVKKMLNEARSTHV